MYHIWHTCRHMQVKPFTTAKHVRALWSAHARAVFVRWSARAPSGAKEQNSQRLPNGVG